MNKIIHSIFTVRILYLFVFFICVVSIFSYIYKTFYFQIMLIALSCFVGSILIIKIPAKQKLNQTQSNYESLKNTMLIANKTLPHLRHGLNEETAKIIANIIKTISDVPAVAITDTTKVLAFIGTGCEHHPPGNPIVTQATMDAIKTGKTKIIKSKNEFNCHVKNCICPLESAIIVPLFYKDKVIGTLKLYHTEKGKISNDTVRLATGLANLLNVQIQLSELERQAKLVTEAKLDALQAQINPHFLFNTLNTINMYINKNPEYARKLVIELSSLLRYMLNNNNRYITLEEELNYVKTYILIEKARFGDKLSVILDIDENLKHIMIPVLTIQPLVQNSILHGIIPKSNEGLVKISAKKIYDEIIISVTDNGIGIKKENLHHVFLPGYGTGCGVGIPNVNERLKLLYGDRYGLNIESVYDQGTKAWFKIPICLEGESRLEYDKN